MMNIEFKKILVTIPAILLFFQVSTLAMDAGIGDAISIINSQQEKISVLENRNAQLSQLVLQLQDRLKKLERRNATMAAQASGLPTAADETLQIENEDLQIRNDELLKKIGSLEVELDRAKKKAAMDKITSQETKQAAEEPTPAESPATPSVEGAAPAAPVAPAPAAQEEEGAGLEVNISLDHWDASVSNEGGEIEQKFFPAIKALVGVKDNWTLEVTSMSSDETEDVGGSISSQVTAYGLRYTTDSGTYYTLSKHSVEFDIMFATPLAGVLTAGTIDINGLRLAAGRLFPLSEKWSATAEIGYGMNTNADITATTVVGAGTGNADADEMDYDLTLVYQASREGMTGRLGYRKIQTDISTASGDSSLDLDGFYLGLGYDF